MSADRISAAAWRLARLGIAGAAALVLVGGLLAGSARSLSDSLVLAGFGLLVPSVALGWVGLRAASAPRPSTSSPTSPRSSAMRPQEPVR